MSDDEQAELWQADLELAFDDEPKLVAHEPGQKDTGFRFDPIGAERATALDDVRAQAHQHPLVRAMWGATPTDVTLTFECAC